MDAILSKEGQKRVEHIADGVLEGPRCEDIKQEVEIDINDDMESWTNESIGSENSMEPPPPLPILKPAPTLKPKIKDVESLAHSKPVPAVLPSFTLPQQNQKPGSVPSIPLPLLILNSLQPQQTGQDKNKLSLSTGCSEGTTNELHGVLKEILVVQREHLVVEKEKLDLEKQRLEFDRLVGSQLLSLVPMIGSILQRVTVNGSEDSKGVKRKAEEIDILKDSKILRSVLEQGIRKYMLGEDDDVDDEKESDIENEDDDDDDSSRLSVKK